MKRMCPERRRRRRNPPVRRDPVAGTPPTLLESLRQLFRFEPIIEIPTQSPEEAMRETWLRVGDDLRFAMGRVRTEYDRARRDTHGDRDHDHNGKHS